MEVAVLVKSAMHACGHTTLRPFASHIGVSHGAVAHWLDGSAVPSFEQAMLLAEMAGLDPVPTAASIRLQSPEGQRFRRLLRRLAAAAACVAFACGLMPSRDALAASTTCGPESASAYTLCALLRRVFTYLTKRRRPTARRSALPAPFGLPA
jgi:hypothetical protein